MPSIIDPYASSSSGGDAANVDDTPPAPTGETPGPDTVLQLYIPAEETVLDFGAGKTPGVRMITQHHLHMTARDPATTFSLGAPGGDACASTLPGVNLYTAAHKNEHIVLTTTESYDGAATLKYGDVKDETVHLVWTEHGDNAKTATIAGTMTHNFNSEHNLNVGKASVYQYGAAKKETITGDFTHGITGNKSETIGQNWVINVTGQKQETIADTTNTSHGGIKHDTYAGAQFSFNLGPKIAMEASIAFSRTAGVSMAQNNTIAIARNFVTQSTTTLDLASADMTTEKIQAKIQNHAMAKIVTATFTAFK